MKKSLIMLGAGACVLLAFPSCQSSKNSGGYGDYEEATMASDTIADGDIPPWLLEDDGSDQISAGERTLSRNDYAIPEPDEALAETGSRMSSSRQNQPKLADNDVSVEKPTLEVPQWENPVPDSAVTAIAPPPAKPIAKTTAPKANKPSAKTGKKSSQGSRAKRYKEPTMITYTVRPGDNLSDIAKRSRTTVAQIKKSSGLKSDTIYPGQIIKVKYSPKNYKPGKAGSKGASKPAAKTRNHVVAKGETISGIAKKYGVSTSEVLRANNMSGADAMKIRAGKRIVIPAKASSASKKNTKRKKR